jgi:peptide/nickel transport system ATP-binding protein
MSAIPVPDLAIEATRTRMVLQGDAASPTHLPPGCRFHTRCPWAIAQCQIAQCQQEEPILRNLGREHHVACHLYYPSK